jgi:hypothetical protein
LNSVIQNAGIDRLSAFSRPQGGYVVFFPRHTVALVCLVAALVLALLAPPADARNNIRNAFFGVYPAAEGSRLDDLPSASGHCGVCHFAFGGSGARNPYGLAVEVAIGQLGDNTLAIESVHDLDSDNDGYPNGVEITDLAHFTNTPTFPGLRDDHLDQVLEVDPDDLEGYLTPGGSDDHDPPEVTVLAPAGGELLTPGATYAVGWSAEDESGIASVDIDVSYDGGATFKATARALPPTGAWDWFVPNRPGAAVLRVTAHDGAGNLGAGDSPAFAIDLGPAGVVPTTLRDFDMPGSQPFDGGVLEDPSVTCVTCHGGYDTGAEPWHAWLGSMMAQAMRDPHYLATLAIAEQDAPGAGDLCLRCHTPGGWAEGRSDDTGGGLINAKDRHGVQCDFCHRLVDPVYREGVSPVQDLDILAALTTVPPGAANGQFVLDPDPMRRGPYADAIASHEFLESPFHLSADLCGTCHDVSNPVFEQDGDPAVYVPGPLDAPHSDGDRRHMFPVERTFSEWQLSDYADGGVYAPQFAGNKPDGVVSTCQDCHMADVRGAGANEAGAPTRDDLALHDLTGGNHWVPDILPTFYPDEVDVAALQDGKARAVAMLQLAATLDASLTMNGGAPELSVTVTNETGHKLPSGYPEGRRMWINVRAFDTGGATVYESCAYDPATGVLTHDADARIYEVKPGLSHRLAGALGAEPGPSFHFALGDTIWFDNRIPPRGFDNAAFTAAQCAPAGHAYADGQHHDLAVYGLPAAAVRAEVALYYQSTSKEYVEFLRDANVTNDMGQRLYDAWVQQGRAAPVLMASADAVLDLTVAEDVPVATRLLPAAPNPFNPMTTLRFRLAAAGRVRLAVYDPRGRLVRVLAGGPHAAGEHVVRWNGRDHSGRGVAAGSYLAVLEADGKRHVTAMALVR